MNWIPTGPALLFCPADRPDRYAKAAAAADTAILDLEDAVAAENKAAARQALVEHPLDPRRTVVRLNPIGSDEHARDLEALAATSYRYVMLAKSESPEQICSLQPFQVIALCETPRGVLAAEAIAACGATAAMMWGAEDLIASLGGRSSRNREGRHRAVASHARSQVLLAASAHGLAAIDAAYLDISDLNGLKREAEDAAASGFAATPCIHPSQVPVVRAAYCPSPEDLEWATEVLAIASGSQGAFVFRGQMVDEPVLRRARQLLSSAGGADPTAR